MQHDALIQSIAYVEDDDTSSPLNFARGAYRAYLARANAESKTQVQTKLDDEEDVEVLPASFTKEALNSVASQLSQAHILLSRAVAPDSDFQCAARALFDQCQTARTAHVAEIHLQNRAAGETFSLPPWLIDVVATHYFRGDTTAYLKSEDRYALFFDHLKEKRLREFQSVEEREGVWSRVDIYAQDIRRDHLRTAKRPRLRAAAKKYLPFVTHDGLDEFTTMRLGTIESRLLAMLEKLGTARVVEVQDLEDYGVLDPIQAAAVPIRRKLSLLTGAAGTGKTEVVARKCAWN